MQVTSERHTLISSKEVLLLVDSTSPNYLPELFRDQYYTGRPCAAESRNQYL